MEEDAKLLDTLDSKISGNTFFYFKLFQFNLDSPVKVVKLKVDL